MTGPIVRFTTQADLDAFAASVDASLGYPKDAVNVGGGIHASATESRTYSYGRKLKHPSLPLFAFHPWDAGAQASAVAVPIQGTVATLDATWDGATVVAPAVAQTLPDAPPADVTG